jgi:hypothetical protein
MPTHCSELDDQVKAGAQRIITRKLESELHPKGWIGVQLLGCSSFKHGGIFCLDKNRINTDVSNCPT